MGAHLLAARYDEFNVLFLGDPCHPEVKTAAPGRWRIRTTRASTGDSRSSGCASKSDVPARVVLLGETAFATESKVELSARYTLSGSF
jgi:hypothetical protein